MIIPGLTQRELAVVTELWAGPRSAAQIATVLYGDPSGAGSAGRFLRRLERRELVERDPESGRWRLATGLRSPSVG